MKRVFDFLAMQRHKYDLTPIGTTSLMTHEGFRTYCKYIVYLVQNHQEFLQWDMDEVHAAMDAEHYTDRSPEGYASFYMGTCAEESAIERGMLNYGMQVAGYIGRCASIAGIRAIGAESKLAARPQERGVRDLDLALDARCLLSGRDIDWIFAVKRDAERKTGIRVDVIGNGIPVDENSAEHVLAVFDEPLATRGFPLYWTPGFLEDFLRRKIEYCDEQAKLLGQLKAD